MQHARPINIHRTFVLYIGHNNVLWSYVTALRMPFCARCLCKRFFITVLSSVNTMGRSNIGFSTIFRSFTLFLCVLDAYTVLYSLFVLVGMTVINTRKAHSRRIDVNRTHLS